MRSHSLSSILLAVVVTAHLAGPPAGAATLYRPGDIVEDFSLVNRATGQPMRLTDFEGRIVILDWFAWWCPFCQAAAPQLRSGIKDYYEARGGNPAGIPVLHVGVNLQAGQETQTENFVTRAGYDVVLQDFSRSVANRIANGGQPLFAIINGVTNSTSHGAWELLYSRQGYGQTVFPIPEFLAAIDAVQAPAAAPIRPARLSDPVRAPDGQLTFHLLGDNGRIYRIEVTSDWVVWTTGPSVVATGVSQPVTLPAYPTSDLVVVRAVSP